MNIPQMDPPRLRRRNLRLRQACLPLAIATALSLVIVVVLLGPSHGSVAPPQMVRGFVVNDRFSPNHNPAELAAT